MKVNNPLNNGPYKITEYKGIPVYYSQYQNPNTIGISHKGDPKNPKYFIVGIHNKDKINKAIELYGK